MKKSMFLVTLMCLVLMVLCGCQKSEKGREKGADLDYTVVPTKDCPEDFLKELEGKKINSFQMTYQTGEYLYIAVGYGEQKSGGYSIQVHGLYESGDGICLDTSLMGPEEGAVVSGKVSCPYLVIKTMSKDKIVYFE